MDQQPEATEPREEEETPAAPVRSPALSPPEVLFVFLACMLVGFIGVLIGFIPLVFIAMAAPLIVSLLA